jgi:enoyl-CoA hydratase/carnithine racemase
MTVHYRVEGGRATVTIDRQDVLNALDRPTLDAIRDRFGEASRDPAVGVVVLTGAGERAFSTGADLAEQESFLTQRNGYWTWMGHFIDAIDAIRDCPYPTVARLNGMVVGGGNELNLACDLAVAADDVIIRHVGPSRGSMPAGGATQWLPITIGDRRAREMLFLNREVSAAQALEWGLVNRVVPRAELDAEVDDLCGELLAKLPETIRATKAQAHFWKDLSWSLTIRHAREWLTIHADSAEVREGLASFAQKRPPDYDLLRQGMSGDVTAGTSGDSTGTETQVESEGQPEGHGQTVYLSGASISCPDCGRGPFSPDFSYCAYCGAALLEGSPP